MKHGSLFSGIGGFDLAAEWMGWDNVFHCEWNPFGQKILKHYWPMAESFEDITKTDFTKYANKIDILTGGFPCQPYSSAGKRLGKEDERHLWPEMLRAIREISPRFVVGENVRGLLSWNGGMVFEEVCVELENLGYQVAPVVIPASGVNAPHRRERIWFVAYAKDRGHRGWLCKQCSNGEWELFQNQQGGGAVGCKVARCCGIWNATNTNRDGFEQRRGHDGVGQNVNGGNTPFKRATNSKDIDGCNTNGISQKQSTVGPRISEQTNAEKIKFTTTKGICKLDQRHNKCKGIITINKCKIINCGTLVQKGFQRIQSPKHRGMGKDCKDISSDGTNECENDGTIINRMEGYVANTRGIGFQREGESTQLEGGRFSFNNPQNNKTTWDNFPTQSPICSGDDGLPTDLDGIAFSKWRQESIKGFGNAIVPQVAFEIFKAIQQCDNESLL
jgi:DNA (cytosine-5)-methyltransferase 1